MRILMLTQFYPPIIGGEERHVRNLSRELVARGHVVSVATLWQDGAPEFEYDQGVRVYRIRASVQRMAVLFSEKNRRHAPPFPDPELLCALRRIILYERPDIVHAHNWLVHSFTPLKAWSKAKLVMTLHDFSHLCATKRYMYHKEICSGPYLQKCLKCAMDHYGVVKGGPTVLTNWFSGMIERKAVDMFLPVSRAVAEGAQLHRRKVRYHVVPNFVPDNVSDLCDNEPLIEQLPQEGYLLFVGDVGYDKGAGVLLRAYEEMGYHVPLVLIGRPVVSFAVNLLPNVVWLQNWPHQAVMHAWRRCSVGVVPSLCPDACPTVAMEAMAMERPVVGSRIGGLPDIIDDGRTGLLVPAGNWRALGEALKRLLDDPVLCTQMGVQGRKKVAEFQAKTVIPCIEQVYQEVMLS